MEELGADDPRQIGEYRLLRRIGAGGMGRVYLGRTAGGRTVAVKQVHGDFAADHEFRVRFRQEVAAARRVGGRWTAPVLDADTEGPMPWVATGYVAGPSLHAAVHEFGPLPSAAVRALGAGLAEALAAVHRLGLVHRDVKPSNVLLALDGPRLIDFGISRALDGAVQLTRTGFLVGSPGYLSPEQAQGIAAGPASDVFSLGAVLAFAATGRPPFGEEAAPAVLLYRVLHEDPDLRGVDAELHLVIAACMAKNPADRPGLDLVRTRLDPNGAGAAKLGGDGWLPPAVSASVGRAAVELLDLDTEPGTPMPDVTVPIAAPVRTAPPRSAPPPTPFAVPMTVTGPPPVAGPRQYGVSTPWPPSAAPQTAPTAWPPAGPGPARADRRGMVIAAGASVAAAAVVGLGVWAVAASSAKGAGQPGTTTPAGSIPSGFIGSWQGSVVGGSLSQPLDFQITVRQGTPGAAVAHIRNDSGGGSTCDADAELVSAGGARMVLTTIPSSVSSNCVPITDSQYYTLNSDGTMHLTVAGLEGDLAKD